MSKKGLPNNYFKDLSNRIKGEFEKLPDDLKVNAPLLYSLRDLNGYKLPENYFAVLKNQLSALTGDRKSRTITLKTWLFSAAAGFTIIIASVLVFSNLNDSIHNESLDELAFEEAYEFYDENLDDIDLDFLSELDIQEDNWEMQDLEEEEIEKYVSLILDDFTDLELEDLY